jgi:iron complex transport system substrate-binding protein
MWYTYRFSFTPIFIWACCCGLAALLMQCGQGHDSVSEKKHHAENLVQHAVGFSLEQHPAFTLLHLHQHYDTQGDSHSYLLLPKGQTVPDTLNHLEVIHTPVEKIALLHSSYVSYFDVLQAEESIAGISEVNYLYDSSIRNAVETGQIAQIGYGESLNIEKLMTLAPDLVITVGFPNQPNKDVAQIQRLGIPVLVFGDWQEHTALGRAEWLKIVAHLTGRPQAGQAFFQQVANRYDSLTLLATEAVDEPVVICNLPYKNVWYMPGGHSYVAQLLHDAGARYPWSDNDNTGAINLDFEAVYPVGLTADYWLTPNMARYKREILAQEPRVRDFKSFREGKVYNSTKRIDANGANDYWESGLVRPELILSDMIKIMHPELMPGYALTYFEELP